MSDDRRFQHPHLHALHHGSLAAPLHMSPAVYVAITREGTRARTRAHAHVPGCTCACRCWTISYAAHCSHLPYSSP